MNVKKLLLTVFIVLVFTVIFLLCFRHCVGAEEIHGEISSATQGVTEEETPSDGNLKNEIHTEKEMDEKTLSEGEENIENEYISRGKEIGIYIKEKILPVVVGVLTSVSALLATLLAIKRALSSIGETKDTFKKEAKERDTRFNEQSEYLKKKTDEIEKTLELIPVLEAEVSRIEESTKALITECTYLGKMISLGFSQNKEVISSGNGKKINRLLTECKKISGERDEGERNE